MFGILIILHVLISIGLILVVLMQSGKGGGLSGAFGGGGGGGSQSVFGGAGAATFLNKATVWLAAAFMVSSLLLAVVGGRVGQTSRSVLDETTAGQLPVQPQTLPGGDLGLPPADAGVTPAEGGTEQPAGTEGVQLPVAEPGAAEETGTEIPGAKEEPESPDEGGGTP